MPDFLLLMRHDVEDRAAADDGAAWGAYLSRLRGSGALRGGSAVGPGLAWRKASAPQPARLGIEGYLLVEAASLADAQRLLEGNPNYEAGGTVEIRELPPGP